MDPQRRQAGRLAVFRRLDDFDPVVSRIGDKSFMEKMVQRNLEQSRDNFVAIVEQRVLQPV